MSGCTGPLTSQAFLGMQVGENLSGLCEQDLGQIVAAAAFTGKQWPRANACSTHMAACGDSFPFISQQAHSAGLALYRVPLNNCGGILKALVFRAELFAGRRS